MDETTLPADTVTTETSTSTETSDLEESPNSLANIPSSNLERRESTDSNFSLRPSYKQK